MFIFQKNDASLYPILGRHRVGKFKLSNRNGGQAYKGDSDSQATWRSAR